MSRRRFFRQLAGLGVAIVTGPYAVEGFVDALREKGVSAESIFVREGLMVEQPTTGYPELARRAGIHYGDDVARTPTTKESPRTASSSDARGSRRALAAPAHRRGRPAAQGHAAGLIASAAEAVR
jgi:hypothetical protein